jgi:NDP-sugar pyrophosphorylase family protein
MLRAMFSPQDLFDLKQTSHSAIFERCEYGWDALKKLKSYLAANLKPANHAKIEGQAFVGPNVFIGEGTEIEDGAMIKGPAIIGRNCKIRHNAYIREDVIIGDECVIGNSCEFKHSLLFNGAQVPHFNYVGDSILGHRAHLGAGVKISNVKLGALLGDFTDIGCNAVLNPGTVIGRGSIIYPNVCWRGVLPMNMVAKNKAEIEVVVRRPRTV